jgi:PAS domain S-box-containing protein
MFPGSQGRPTRRAGGGRAPGAAPLLLFLGAVLVVAAAGAIAFRESAAALRAERERELQAVAAIKVEELVRWRDERLADAALLAADPGLLFALGGDAARVAEARRELVTWFEVLRGMGEYDGLAVVDLEGRPRFQVGEGAGAANLPAAREVVRRAAAERRAVLSDLHRRTPDDRFHLLAAAPVLTGASTTAVVLLRIEPRRWLFRTIRSWPSASASAEVLLVRREGDRALILNERDPWGPPTPEAVPLERDHDPAVRAALGAEGVLEGVDRRGARVLAVAAEIPDTPWRLVVKVDRDEALAPFPWLRGWVAAGLLALAIAAAAAALSWARTRRVAAALARAGDEAERVALARRIEHLTDRARELVFLADEHRRIVEANRRAVESLGWSREELVGRSLAELRDPGAPDGEDTRDAGEGSALFETRFRRRDGSTFPVEVSSHSEEVEGRRFFHVVARDVSDRKAAEEALRASEARFRAAFEFASFGVALVTPDGALAETNQAFRRIVGHGEAELRTLTFEALHAPPDRPSAAAIVRQMREGAVASVELPRRFLRRNGSIAEVLLRARALRDADGRGPLRYALAVVEDVTERKRLEAQLMLADRMASVGTLAAGVAHEINNPLAFILANLEFAFSELERAGADPEVLRALGEARDGSVRVREIVRDLRTFSRAESGAKERVDPRSLLQAAIGLAQNEIRHRARLEVDVGDVPVVLGPERRLVQVFVNLLLNAAQAIPEGRPEQEIVHASVDTAPDGRARVAISDSGSGIAPDVRARIFDPFFTTKPVGVGTGLGLAICHGIVSALGGEIQVESEPGRGSTFRVLLPPAPREEAAREETAPAPPAAEDSGPAPVAVVGREDRGARILVVDDDVLVGRAVGRMLSAQHAVVTRSSAREALDELGRAHAGYDVVLCDLMMPDMSGMELHARLRELDPALADRTIFITGGAFTPGAREFLARVPNPRLEKPFDPDRLRELVAGMLARRGAAQPADAAT